MANDNTMVQISKEVAAKIKGRAITPNETYDNILRRLLGGAKLPITAGE